jgi:hypothetical protein
MKQELFVVAILCLSAAVLVNACAGQIQSAAEIYNNERFDSTLNLHVVSYEAKGENKVTNVTVKKYAKAENGNFKFYYDITTPRVDEYLFVLALDSSGSFAYNSGEDPARQAKAVIGAIPDFLSDTISNYKNRSFKLSLVSWDDDIDFAYTRGDFSNNDTSKVRLVPIKDVLDDVKKLSPFVAPDQEGIAYRCEEQDHTNLSQPIKASLDILNADVNQPDDSHRVKKFIILVTGEGESSRCIPRLTEEAKGIPIYVVGMEFKDKTRLLNHLEYDIAGNPKNYFGTQPNPVSLKDDLLRALEAALGKAVSDPVASNVTIIEPIDRCFIPNENATMVIKTHSNEEIPVIGKMNQTTIEYRFPEGLYPDNITELSFDARFALDFPISSIDDFFPSRLTYTWFNDKEFNISIPKNEIRIESQASTTGPSQKPESSEGNSAKPEESEGFGIIQLLLSIAFCKIIKLTRH